MSGPRQLYAGIAGCGTLPAGEEIIFVAGYPPILADKLIYFEDRNFKRRILPAPEKSDVCRPGAAAATADIAECQQDAETAGFAALIAASGKGRADDDEGLFSGSCPEENEDEAAERPVGDKSDDDADEGDDYLHNILMLAQAREEEREEQEHERGISL